MSISEDSENDEEVAKEAENDDTKKDADENVLLDVGQLAIDVLQV